MSNEMLAILGGPQAVTDVPEELFAWPVITEEDEAAVLDVLRRRAMSGIEVTQQFEFEFAAWLGARYALGFHNGTASIQAAMYGCGVGVGDEVICPSTTYWASALPAFSLGATIIFADINPHSLCLDPDDVEKRITSRTKAIIVVHYASYPADMERIMEIARRYGLKVIEDVSHAQGGVYQGKRLGTIGDVGAMSLMSGKAFAIGEAGMLVTDNNEIYTRAIAFGHHERTVPEGELGRFAGLPLGGYKYRMHQMSAAMGRVQLKYYDARVAEIDRAMRYFWLQLEDQRAIHPHIPEQEESSRSGGWYYARGFYKQELLGGLSVTRFCEALQAEGVPSYAGCNLPLHTHPVFNEADVYGHGVPTRNAHKDRDMRQSLGSLPIAETIGASVFGVPWFKQYRPEIIDQYVLAFRKVIGNYAALLEGDLGNPASLGGWGAFFRKSPVSGTKG